MDKRHSQLKTLGNNTMVDPFGANVAAALVYKKMERLMTATHMVTNYVPKGETLRERIRDISSELLSDTIKLRDGFTSLGTGTLQNITAQVRLILSLLDALSASGLISEMNHRVLKEAYIDFTQSLSAMSVGRSADGVELTAEYFSAALQQPQQGGVQEAAAPTTQRAKTPAAQQHTPKKGASVKPSSATHSPALNQTRVETIKDFISKRGSASVGDIAQVITGCSSKTLQRDLAKLVAQGTLTKEGSKRWTRYSLTTA
jgi:hypothetical protein